MFHSYTVNKNDCTKTIHIEARRGFDRYSTFGIAIDRNLTAKWLFSQEKDTSQCSKKQHINSESALNVSEVCAGSEGLLGGKSLGLDGAVALLDEDLHLALGRIEFLLA